MSKKAPSNSIVPTPDYTSRHFFPRPYDVVADGDTAVIIPFFNPAQSVRIIQNLLLVKQLHDRAHIPTYFVELAFDDKPFLFPAADNIFQYRSASYMFYKENLIAIAEKRIPEKYTKLVFMDADIVFDSKDWYAQISEALHSHNVVQPFKTAHYLGFDFKPIDSKLSCVIKAKDPGHTGFVWACQRGWFQSCGFFEKAIIGGGDTCFAYLIGQVSEVHAAYKLDMVPAVKATTKTHLDMSVYHLPHGVVRNRQFKTRIHDLAGALRDLKVLKPSLLLDTRTDGLLEWKPAYRDKMNSVLRRYFEQRKDDDVGP